MRIRVVYLTLVAVLASATGLMSQEAETATVDTAKKELAMEWLKYFVGDWEGTNKTWTAASEEWQDRTTTETSESIAGGMGHITKSKDSNGQETVVLTRWDPGVNTLTRHAVTSIGITWSAVTTNMTNDSLESDLTGNSPDGQTFTGTATLKKTGPNSYSGAWSVSMDGEVLAKSTNEFKRKETKPKRARPSLNTNEINN